MVFRTKSLKVQCLRSFYDPANKRSRQRMIGSFDSSISGLSNVPASLIEKLSSAERDELSVWLSQRLEQATIKQRIEHLNHALDTLTSLRNGIAHSHLDGTRERLAEQANEMWGALGEIQKSLKKSGHPKPQKTRKSRVIDSYRPSPSVTTEEVTKPEQEIQKGFLQRMLKPGNKR